MKNIIIAILFIGFFVFPLSSEIFALDAKAIFKKSRLSVVMIMSFDKNNQPIGIGSGFFIEKSLVILNIHCTLVEN